MSIVLRTMTYRLYPTPAQTARFFHFLYVGRKLYNFCLNERIRYYKETGKTLTKYTQCADLTQLRSVSQVLADVPVEIEREAIDRLDKAFQAFFRRVKLKDGQPVGFPRFKGMNRWNSFGTSKPGKVIVLGNRIRIFGLDAPVRARNVRQPVGKIKQLRIVHKAGKWFARLFVDDQQIPPPKIPVVSSIGIDVGLTSFATFSTGEKVTNPRFGRKLAGKLRRAHQHVSRCKKGSMNRRKAIRHLQRVYARISDQRWNFTHHLSKRIVSENQLIAVEKLTIKNMVRGKLSKSIMDAAWGQLIFQLNYKAENAGVQVVAVDPWGTSQECSKCHEKVLKELKERVHQCPCGLVLDRDENAARNILARAQNTAGSAGINASGEVTEPRRRKKSPVRNTN